MSASSNNDQARGVPFRPRLHGNFRARFYRAASRLDHHAGAETIAAIVQQEIDWVQTACRHNLSQRTRYRAIWLLLRDLLSSSWTPDYRRGVLLLVPQKLHDSCCGTPQEQKQRLRKRMEQRRLDHLQSCRSFVERMERINSHGRSIADLIADGPELLTRLQGVQVGHTPLRDAVTPYLQLVDNDATDDFTGLKLPDIWRYFRLTWSMPPNTAPGRNMMYLVRDAAHPMHAVMGIASLDNCAVQITCRDTFLGWDYRAYIKDMLDHGNEYAMMAFNELLSYLDAGLHDIRYSDIFDDDDIDNPSETVIDRLMNSAQQADQERKRSLSDSFDAPPDAYDMSCLGHISVQAEEALFRKKKAEHLARLLRAKKAIMELLGNVNFDGTWRVFCAAETGIAAIRTALVSQKTRHIGSSMMELSTCGAIPPYNEILGGKLVALLALSPQVIHQYKRRYADKPSTIASRLRGEDVCRPAELAYIGTSSLYAVGSSQYNRLKLPRQAIGSHADTGWKLLGTTEGYGSFHISAETADCLAEATSSGFRRINHVFGEGPSSKMRLISMAVRELLETTSDVSRAFSMHFMPRLVYGACLAVNARDYLMGRAAQPDYYISMDNPEEGTQSIMDYWSARWLAMRLHHPPALQRVAAFRKKQLLVGRAPAEHEERRSEPRLTQLKEHQVMPSDEQAPGLQFIRNFYRGGSAFADYVQGEKLQTIHLKTRLDEAILAAVGAGRDVVLTGNPGDGKTHIIRILEPRLLEFSNPPHIELDASTLTDAEIHKCWLQARSAGSPFIIAINAAVLHELHRNHPDFHPAAMAFAQMCQAVVYSDDAASSPGAEHDVVTFDLSKRSILTEELLSESTRNLIDERHYAKCAQCTLYNACPVTRHRQELGNALFQQRLLTILQRVAMKGYHATIRELLALIAYLIFGDRECEQLIDASGEPELEIVNLIYSGKGGIFNAIRAEIDPCHISHPQWDERLLSNSIDPKSWQVDHEISPENIDVHSDHGLRQFELRKRRFFFFNSDGEHLLGILDDETENFRKFLKRNDRFIIKELLSMLNGFFEPGTRTTTELNIWSGHRYNNEPRKVLCSVHAVRADDFVLGRPRLLSSMAEGIETSLNFVRLQCKDAPDITLKIDFRMYQLLKAAQNGIPVLFTDDDATRKVWRFTGQLKAEPESTSMLQIRIRELGSRRTACIEIDPGDAAEHSSYESIKITNG